MRRLLHLDDTERLDQLVAWLAAGRPPARLASERDRRLAWMFPVTLWGLKNAPDDLDAAWRGLFDAPAVVDELSATLPLLRERIARPSIALPDADVPLRLHATYARDGILAAFGRLAPASATATRPARGGTERTAVGMLLTRGRAGGPGR